MKSIVILSLVIFMYSSTVAKSIELEKKDYISLVVSNYVHGFKEFETSVTAFPDSVSIGVYYDSKTQSKKRANQLAERFRVQIPVKLKEYKWSKNVKVIVNVYSEDRTGRGY